jgi:hypothetical protein
MRERIDVLLRNQRRGDERGVVDALGRLCRTVSEDLDLLGSTVTLMPGVGVHAVSAVSSETALRIEEAQFGAGEGPTREAFTSRRLVLVADLEWSGLQRWPGWVPIALEAGVCAVYAFPLHVGATIFGVLSLYVGSGPRLDTAGLQAALIFSEIATEYLLDGSMPGDDQGLDSELDATLDTNAYVYQAQGMVMVHLGVTLPEALARMRAHAWATERDLTTLADEIVAGRDMPPRDGR